VEGVGVTPPLSVERLAPVRADAYFGERAVDYDSRYDKRDADGYALRSRLIATLRLAGSGPGTVLDAGMGPGRLCAELDARGWTVSGVDAAPEMVEVARARLDHGRERLTAAHIESLPFPDDSFDLVTATGVLEYSDVPRALEELARVLKPGGRAIVSYPNPRALYGIWKTRVWYRGVRAVKRLLGRRHPEFPRGADPIVPERLVAMIESAGLAPLHAVHTSFMPLPTPVDRLLPGLSFSLGARLERRGGATARRFAIQVVYLTRKESRS
jgi:SAM-dependent methyltransferase